MGLSQRGGAGAGRVPPKQRGQDLNRGGKIPVTPGHGKSEAGGTDKKGEPLFPSHRICLDYKNMGSIVVGFEQNSLIICSHGEWREYFTLDLIMIGL